MDYFTDNSAPRDAVVGFLIGHGAALPADLTAKLREVSASPSIVDVTVNTGELLYARRDDLPKEGLILGAQFGAFRSSNDWVRDQDGSNTRANGITYAMMREAKEPAPAGVSYPKKEDDPAPLDAYVKPPEPATSAVAQPGAAA